MFDDELAAVCLLNSSPNTVQRVNGIILFPLPPSFFFFLQVLKGRLSLLKVYYTLGLYIFTISTHLHLYNINEQSLYVLIPSPKK